MVRGGDELGQTQGGNNNAYCQDNEISWLDWNLTPAQTEFLEFCRRVIRIRQENSVLRRRRFLHGNRIRGLDIKDITWLAPSGREMTEHDWNQPMARCLGVRLVSEEEIENGEPNAPNALLLLFNAYHEPVPFRLPPLGSEEKWNLLLDTSDDRAPMKPRRAVVRYPLEARSVAVLRREKT
jgi:glycogen operon protein